MRTRAPVALALLLAAGCHQMGSPSLAHLPSLPPTSDRECGPALLDLALRAHGLPPMTSEVRARLDGDETGTSIDSLEAAANSMGLPSEQQLVPADFLPLDRRAFLPAMVVGRGTEGKLYYSLWWDASVSSVDEISCGHGKRQVAWSEGVSSLYIHEMTAPAREVEGWLRGREVSHWLMLALMRSGESPKSAKAVLAQATARPGWIGLATLDASIRSGSPNPSASDFTVRESGVANEVFIRGAIVLQFSASR